MTGLSYHHRIDLDGTVYTYIPANSPLFRSHDSGQLSHSLYRRSPYLFGIRGACACHPAPNPAARDYWRRTKHRRRRRK